MTGLLDRAFETVTAPAPVAAPAAGEQGPGNLLDMAFEAAPSGGASRVVQPTPSPETGVDEMGNPLWVPPTTYRDGVDVTTGGPAVDRAAVSIKMTPQGKLGYLQSKYGQENARLAKDNALEYRDPESGAWRRLSPEGFQGLSDASDFAGPGIVAAPSLLTRRPTRAAAGSALGSGIRQAVSSFLPGDDEMTPGDRAADVATNAAAGGLTQGAVNLGIKAFNYIRPHNVAARYLRSVMDKPETKEGLAVEAESGVPLSLGQASGSRPLLTMEGLARRHPLSGNKVQTFDRMQLEALQKKLNEGVNATTPGHTGTIQTGHDVAKTYEDAVKVAAKIRRAQADGDFGRVTALSQGKPLVATENLRGELETLIREFDVPGATDAAQKVVNGAKQMLKSLSAKTPASASPVLDASGASARVTPAQYPMVTAENANRMLQVYTDASRGTGKLFEDLDTGQSRMLAGRLRSAFERDLDSVPDDLGAEAVAALRQARANWKQHSQTIEAMGETALGRYLKGGTRSPEDVLNAVKNMDPSEITQTMVLLESHNKGMADAVRRQYLEQAIEAARVPPTQRSANAGMRLSAAKVANSLEEGPRLAAMFAGNKNAQMEIDAAAKAALRLADRGGTEASPTAPLQFAAEVAKSTFSANPMQIAGSLLAGMAPGKVADLLMNPQGRQAILTLRNTTAPTAKTSSALALLAAFAGLEE